MGTLTLGAAPVAPAIRYQHASGDFTVVVGFPRECRACWDELDQEAGETEPRTEPHEAYPDSTHPDACFLCGHDIERAPDPETASLPCPDCENASCRCAA